MHDGDDDQHDEHDDEQVDERHGEPPGLWTDAGRKVRGMSDRETPSSESEAKALGCTCEWWARGAIITFDSECPILERHRGVPDGAGDVPLADKVIRRLGLSTTP